MRIKYKTFFVLAAVYLSLPIFIYFVGFYKVIPAILFGALTVFSVFWTVRDCDKNQDKTALVQEENEITISKSTLIISGVIFLLWCFLSGIGGFVWQTYDHCVRNAVFNDLVKYDWPLYYDMSLQSNPEVHEYFGDGTFAFSYYFTFWLVPSLFGKLFGLTVGKIVLIIWSAFGVFLAYVGTAFINKKISLITTAIFIFFSGWDVLPFLYYTFTNTTDEIFEMEGYAQYFVFACNTTSIYNVFNQVIPIWIIVMLILSSKNSRSIGFIGSVAFSYTPWGTFTVLPLALCKLIMHIYDLKGAKDRLKGIFTVNNILMPVILLASYGLMYTANPAATHLKGFIWEFYPIGKIILMYILLMVFDVLPFLLILLKSNKKNPMFLTAVIILALLPMYRITFWNDFCSRGSMAPLFVLCILLAGYAEKLFSERPKKSKEKADLKLKKMILALVMLIGFGTPAGVIVTGITFTVTDAETAAYGIVSFGDIADSNYMYMVEEQFYIKDYSDSLYFKYLSK